MVAAGWYHVPGLPRCFCFFPLLILLIIIVVIICVFFFFLIYILFKTTNLRARSCEGCLGNPMVSLQKLIGPPVLPFYIFFGGGCPIKIYYRKRLYPYSNLKSGGPRLYSLAFWWKESFKDSPDVVKQMPLNGAP